MLRTEKRVVKIGETSLLKDILYLLLKILVIIVAFGLIFTFMFGLYRNADVSMSPSIKDGDLVVYYRLDKHYISQDTVVLKYKGKLEVRRVVATAGDRVDITSEGLLVNGAIQQEKDIFSKTERFESGIEFPITLKEGEIFVLGDNRVNSVDSRIYGPVEIKNTLGKGMAIFRRRNI